MKRHIMVEDMDDTSKKVLAEFLAGHNKEIWDRSEAELHEDLSVESLNYEQYVTIFAYFSVTEVECRLERKYTKI